MVAQGSAWRHAHMLLLGPRAFPQAIHTALWLLAVNASDTQNAYASHQISAHHERDSMSALKKL